MKVPIFLFFWALSISLNAQTDPVLNKQTAPPSPVMQDTGDTLLKYSAFLKDEDQRHRDFLENYYNKTIWLFSIIGGGFTITLAFLNWKSKKDIETEVGRRFDASISKSVDRKLKELTQSIETARLKSEEDAKMINQILVELASQKSQVHTGGENDFAPSLSLKGKTILWVDDYPENNSYPKTIFEQLGAKVRLATSTEKAFEVLASLSSVDLIISDMGRGPNPTAGLDFLEQLKTSSYKAPVIIYASRDSLKKYGGRARELGASETINGVIGILKTVPEYLSGQV